MAPVSANEEVLITLGDDASADIHELASRLKKIGLSNPNILASTGIITGNAHPDLIEKLRAEPGVGSIERGGEVHIPPPDSDVQ